MSQTEALALPLVKLALFSAHLVVQNDVYMTFQLNEFNTSASVDVILDSIEQ